MLKKILITSSFIMIGGYTLLSYSLVTKSAVPELSRAVYSQCSSQVSTDHAADITDYDMCCVSYRGAMEAVKKDWQNNLQLLTEQEKPASEMTQEAYEGIRTYNCWLEYICRAVEYSSRAPIEGALGTGLLSDHIGTVPGCQAPEDLTLEVEYGNFTNTMKEIPLVGIVVSNIDDLYINNRIDYFPHCMTDPSGDNLNPSITIAAKNYKECKEALQQVFSCTEEELESGNTENCAQTSSAYVTVETALKKTNADQKARVLEKKLATIVPKLQNMEMHVGYLSDFLTQLDARFACYIKECD